MAIKAQNLVFQIFRQGGLPFLDDLRLKRRSAVLGCFYIQAAFYRLDSLGGPAIHTIAVCTLFVVKMVIDYSFNGGFQELFEDRRKSTVFTK